MYLFTFLTNKLIIERISEAEDENTEKSRHRENYKHKDGIKSSTTYKWLDDFKV